MPGGPFPPSQVEEIIYKSEGSSVWKGLMRYMNKDWKEV